MLLNLMERMEQQRQYVEQASLPRSKAFPRAYDSVAVDRDESLLHRPLGGRQKAYGGIHPHETLSGKSRKTLSNAAA